MEELTKDLLVFLIMQEKDFKMIEVQNNICINVFGYENKLVFPIYISDKKLEDVMDLLLLIDDNKSHYVYIKNFNRFMFRKMKNKNKKWFCKYCLQCFSKENVLIKRKEDCLSTNGKQSVQLEEGTIEFQNYFKQIPVPFKIYADIECNLERVQSYKVTQKNIKITFLVGLLTKLFVLMIHLVNQLLFIEVKMLLMNLLKQFLKNISIANK